MREMPCFSTNLLQRSAQGFPCFCAFTLLFLSILSLLRQEISPVHAEQTHSCAPDIPPPIAGAPLSPPPDPGLLLINEVLANPASSWNCSEAPGTYSRVKDSWLEIYNPQNQAFDLHAGGMRVSIDGKASWFFLPEGSAIPSGGYLVLFPLEWQQATAPEAWNVVLDIGGVIIDQASIPLLQSDQAYARVPDGSVNWQLIDAPTIKASNAPATPSITTNTPQAELTPQKGNTNTKSPTPVSNGTQPAWKHIQFPGTPASEAHLSPVTTRPDSAQQLPPQTEPSPDSGKIVLFATLIVLFSGALLWCWRLFHSP